MECKDRSSFTVVASSIGINRNIVECKESTNRSIFGKRCGVLIETLWNVKKIKEMDRYYAELVLIETLWNVKIVPLAHVNDPSVVLIETLWNVKLVVGKIIGNEIRY